MIEMNVNLDVVLRDGEFFRNIDPFIGLYQIQLVLQHYHVLILLIQINII
jgi:hypothetical protein